MISGSPSAKARTRRRRTRPSWPRRRQAPGDSYVTVRGSSPGRSPVAATHTLSRGRKPAGATPLERARALAAAGLWAETWDGGATWHYEGDESALPAALVAAEAAAKAAVEAQDLVEFRVQGSELDRNGGQAAELGNPAPRGEAQEMPHPLDPLADTGVQQIGVIGPADLAAGTGGDSVVDFPLFGIECVGVCFRDSHRWPYV